MTKNCGPLNILDIFSTASLSLVIVEKKTVCARNGFLFTEVFFGTKNKILRSANRALENMSTLKSAYLGVDKPTFERGGGGVGDFRNILQTDSEEKKIVARTIIPGEKNFLY